MACAEAVKHAYLEAQNSPGCPPGITFVVFVLERGYRIGCGEARFAAAVHGVEVQSHVADKSSSLRYVAGNILLS